MRAPAFWWRQPGLAAHLLRPAAALYGAVAAARLSRGGATFVLPVICVGNVTVGGSGKTPTALALALALRQRGLRPAFLTRGYRGRLAGPVLVDAARHGAADVGDEPLILARHAPTVVSRDRPAGAALCAASGVADVIVMDDGLQNPSLAKDLRLAVFDGAVGCGNGLVLPAGPLRAPLSRQWPLVDAAIVIGPGAPGDDVAAQAVRRGMPVLRASLVPEPGVAATLAGRRVLAVAGIGRPSKFAETLRLCGAQVERLRPFPDHHPYTPREVARLIEEAAGLDLRLVTTEKDWARLAGFVAILPRLAEALVLPVTLGFDDPSALLRLLAGVERLTPPLGPSGGGSLAA